MWWAVHRDALSAVCRKCGNKCGEKCGDNCGEKSGEKCGKKQQEDPGLSEVGLQKQSSGKPSYTSNLSCAEAELNAMRGLPCQLRCPNKGLTVRKMQK